MSSEPLYFLNRVCKEYKTPTECLQILRSIDLRIESKESVAVIGASGSGKTTLLHIMGTLDIPSSGEVHFAGRPLAGLSVCARAELRNREIGFVFQFHHLLAEFTTLENVAMPGIIGGMDRDEALKQAREILELVGLEHRISHRVTTLSGGERQRAAIARALLLRPKVVLADEPTGNLDEKSGRSIGELLVSLNQSLGMTFIVVTHNVELASILGRILELRSGEIYAR